MSWRPLALLITTFLMFNLSLSFANDATPILCKQRYALCSAAKCMPDPRNPKLAICNCENFDGYSVGLKSCEARAPKMDGKLEMLTSTFSFRNKMDPVMNCPAGTYWTNCMDAPCTSDPTNPDKSICSCPIEQSKSSLVTFGGDCRTHTCENYFWSGALDASNSSFQETLAKKIGLDLNKAITQCPAKGENHE